MRAAALWAIILTGGAVTAAAEPLTDVYDIAGDFALLDANATEVERFPPGGDSLMRLSHTVADGAAGAVQRISLPAIRSAVAVPYVHVRAAPDEAGPRRDEAARRLRDIGVGDGTAFGDVGRVYFYAAASGRSVGLNMLPAEGGGWDQAGWSSDPHSTLIGDAQVGVAWRQGPMQTSFGYLRREVKGRNMIFGQRTRDDSLVALSVSLKPGV